MSDATWAESSVQAGCNCPAAIALALAHALRSRSAADCASGRRGDADQPWKHESSVRWMGWSGEQAKRGGKTGEAAVVKLVWGYSEWRNERWVRGRIRKMKEADTCS